MSQKHIHMVVEGRVQGVGFRYFVHHQAGGIGVKGYVRNLNDGRVEIEAEGTTDQIDRFIRICSQGPARAEVTRFFVSELEIEGFKTFQIK